MQNRIITEWEKLTSQEFKKLRDESGVCILPIGCLERHCDTMPLGTDMIIARGMIAEATQIEPCVVFPTYYFSQVSESTAFTGAFALDNELLLKTLDATLDEIGRNGFKKILIANFHGGNDGFLRYYVLSTCAKKRDYTLYLLPSYSYNFDEEEQTIVDQAILSPENDKKHGGHADEWEGSLVKAIEPGLVKDEYNTSNEPVAPLGRMRHLGSRLFSGHWWYADYPFNVTDRPYLADEERGRTLLEVCAKKIAKEIRIVKDDTVAPALQAEFLQKRENPEF